MPERRPETPAGNGHAPSSGTVVFHRYKLDRVLGRGGMGVVWLAEDMKLERPVALKFLPSLIGLDPSAVSELKTETRRGLELSHPNILRIYDFVDDEDAAAISMEFVDGKTLSELRMSTEAGVFTVAEVSQWLPGVCDALDYAHFHRQVVHRDLKPANIMVTTQGVPKIADFGIARSLADTMSRLTAAHLGGSGTLPYMSPQQAMGEKPLPTDDVYSLAATVYEMLAGKPPFYRGDMPTQITTKVPPSMQQRRIELEIAASDTIPPEWEAAIALALHKDPAMRPASAGALAEMMGIRASGTPSWTSSFSLPSAPPAKRRRYGRAIAAAGALAVLGAGAILWWASQQHESRLTRAAASMQSRPVPGDATDGAAPAGLPTTPATPMSGPPRLELQPGLANSPTLDALTPPTIPLLRPLPVNPAELLSDSGLNPINNSAPSLRPLPGVLAPPRAAQSGLAPSETPGSTDGGAQPSAVVPPEAGFWELDEMFPEPPFSAYSHNGKRYLIYSVQSALKKQGLYTESLDGKPGKGTYKAIVVFQVNNSLSPRGLLDPPTLAALGLAEEADKADWNPPTDYVRRRRSSPPPKPGLMDRVKKMFK